MYFFSEMMRGFPGSHFHGLVGGVMLCLTSYYGYRLLQVAEKISQQAEKFGGPFAADLGDADEVRAATYRQFLVGAFAVTAGLLCLAFTVPGFPPLTYPVLFVLVPILLGLAGVVNHVSRLRVQTYVGDWYA